MRRIEFYLREEEVPEWASAFSTSTASEPESDGTIGFSKATFEWQAMPKSASAGDPHFQLGSLDFIFPYGNVTLISGATGSGKSAVLAALLGEMHCLTGRVHLDKQNHQVAYCAQTPCKLLVTLNFGPD